MYGKILLTLSISIDKVNNIFDKYAVTELSFEAFEVSRDFDAAILNANSGT